MNSALPTARAVEEPPRPRPSSAGVTDVLAHLEAGDRAAAAGTRAEALTEYGQALDACLNAELLGLAATVLRRMIQHYPDVVRARMTLALLPLCEGVARLAPESLRHSCSGLEDYARAASAAGLEATAAQRLRRLAAITESAAVRERIAALLSALGDHQGAEAAMDATAGAEEREEFARLSPQEQRGRWLRLLVDRPAGQG